MTTTEPAVLTMRDIEDLANDALKEHGLFYQGWRFEWDRAVRRAGLCSYRRKVISLSRPIYSIEANREGALNTILHEVAHALAGHSAGHGPVWKATARRIGAKPERCYSTDEVTPLKGKVVGTCNCGSIHHRHRTPLMDRTYSCKRCNATVTWAVNR